VGRTSAPTGRPRDGQRCPGPAGYEAWCGCGCGWTYRDGLRTVVEEKRRTYRGGHPPAAGTQAGAVDAR
jgi:hypothetical protein